MWDSNAIQALGSRFEADTHDDDELCYICGRVGQPFGNHMRWCPMCEIEWTDSTPEEGEDE